MYILWESIRNDGGNLNDIPEYHLGLENNFKGTLLDRRTDVARFQRSTLGHQGPQLPTPQAIIGPQGPD